MTDAWQFLVGGTGSADSAALRKSLPTGLTGVTHIRRWCKGDTPVPFRVEVLFEGNRAVRPFPQARQHWPRGRECCTPCPPALGGIMHESTGHARRSPDCPSPESTTPTVS
jgi:hypothetical protein